jgi:hypothetical protein
MAETKKTLLWVLFWPFSLLWSLASFILEFIGRILCALIGLVLMVAGVVLTMSIAAAPIGIPLTAFGFLLLIRAVF